MKKILIIGEAGRGKTTLAEKISDKLKIEHHSTDDFYWEVKYSKPREREVAVKLTKDQFGRDEWIVEGTTTYLIKAGLEDADVIIFLTFRNVIQQWFLIIYRAIKNKRGTFAEVFDLLRHVTLKRYGWGYQKGKVTLRELIAPYSDKVVELDSFRKINRFLENL